MGKQNGNAPLTLCCLIHRQQRENTPVRHWHHGCTERFVGGLGCRIIPTPVLDEFLVEPVARTMYAETGEEVFLNPAREPPLREYNPNQPKRTQKIANTKPTGGVERFDPFHSTHYYAEAEAQTKWVNLLERHMEPKLPNWYEALIAEFSGEVEKERGGIFTKWRFFRDVNKDLTTKAFREIEKKIFEKQFCH